MNVRIFTPAELEDLGVLDLDVGETDATNGVTVVADVMIEHKRWSLKYYLAFRLRDQPEDEAWQVAHFVPATESQEQDPWGEHDKVKARLVRRTLQTVEVWS
jgi:hypothetical protein